MTLSFKYIGLIIGIVLVFASFLFFGRQQDTYQILLFGGIAAASIFYLTILFGKGSFKSKLYWTGFVVLSIALQPLTEPILINTSYRFYISQNKKTLTDVNNILRNKKGDIFILNDDVSIKGDLLTPGEVNKLKEGRTRLGVNMIYKFDTGVYYELWGFLDVRLGITYLPNQDWSDEKYDHVTGNWFH